MELSFAFENICLKMILNLIKNAKIWLTMPEEL